MTKAESQAVVSAFTSDVAHQVIIGKSRDGKSFPKDTPREGGSSSASDLLAALLSRI